MGENNSFIDFENMTEDSKVEEKLLNESSQENEMLREVITKNNAKAEAEMLYKTSKDENEKLLLRNSVIQGAYDNDVKIKILDLLDAYMREELKSEVNLANSLPEIKKQKSNLLLGAVAIVIIGFIVSIFFPFAWLIGIVLSVFGYISAKKEKEVEMQKATAALEKVERYRNAGYRL